MLMYDADNNHDECWCMMLMMRYVDVIYNMNYMFDLI